MDTIIYLSMDNMSFTGERQDSSPVFSIRKREGTYKLLAIKIQGAYIPEYASSGKQEARQDAKLGIKQRVRQGAEVSRKQGKVSKWSLWRWLGNRRMESERRRLVHTENEWVQGIAGQVLKQVSAHLSDTDACYTVYDDSVERWMNKAIGEEWQERWRQYWPFSTLSNYREMDFVEELLAHNHSHYYLILGYDRCLEEVILNHIRYMKGLRLVLEYIPEEFQDFLEDIYEEYGLAAGLQMLPESAKELPSPYRNVRVFCKEPSVVMDFSGEDHILTADVAKGSIWLDMDSMEEKRRRIQERNTGIHYFSMKTEWKVGFRA